MNVIEKCPLKSRNTFGIEASADLLMEFESEEELRECLSRSVSPVFTIGGGSNLLFLNDYHGTLLHSIIKGIEPVCETDECVFVKVGSGVVWDDFVEYSVRQGWWGTENLTAIPGEVGAGAVQNIGAYGTEIKDIIHEVEAISVPEGMKRTFAREECMYGYRDSIFKNELKGRYVVTYVTFRLQKHAVPNLEYGTLKESVNAGGGATLENIRRAVKQIRDSKLPDPHVTGNAGSFFMNPVISDREFQILKRNYPDIPSYGLDGGLFKVPAGWLIERCGWKGRALGPAAVHDRQALVLVNRGGATGADVKALADTIISDVKKKFGITLRTEVNYIS